MIQYLQSQNNVNTEYHLHLPPSPLPTHQATFIYILPGEGLFFYWVKGKRQILERQLFDMHLFLKGSTAFLLMRPCILRVRLKHHKCIFWGGIRAPGVGFRFQLWLDLCLVVGFLPCYFKWTFGPDLPLSLSNQVVSIVQCPFIR